MLNNSRLCQLHLTQPQLLVGMLYYIIRLYTLLDTFFLSCFKQHKNTQNEITLYIYINRWHSRTSYCWWLKFCTGEMTPRFQRADRRFQRHCVDARQCYAISGEVAGYGTEQLGVEIIYLAWITVNPHGSCIQWHLSSLDSADPLVFAQHLHSIFFWLRGELPEELQFISGNSTYILRSWTSSADMWKPVVVMCKAGCCLNIIE